MDIEKIGMLVKLVDRLIAIRNIRHILDEEKIADVLATAVSVSGTIYTDEELEQARKDIRSIYMIYTTPGHSLVADYEQGKWYEDRKSEIIPKYWSRYKNYLIDDKNFSPNVVATLGDDTLDQKLMNYLLDPEVKNTAPLLKRGLIIGDVQSGKTSTYIGLMCKAADAGYKVFILLTGTIETLRQQTQERVEEGFIGINMSADTTGGERVGVGLDNKPITAMALTSRASDFRGNSDKIAATLSRNDGAVVFVIKKNTTTLTKLTNWLITLNADPVTKKIDFPMLMIDDEADNASINTGASKEDPTTINKLIRGLANLFTVSNYVGFTATPFANVFIDPASTENMENQDLFPEDFIVSLPTPSNYIGPGQIFSKEGAHHNQLVYVTDAGREEADGFPFYFKHQKTWEDTLPESLTDAIYTFYLANAIRDIDGDTTSHRSMLVNISRFINVQKYIECEIEAIHKAAYRSIKFNLSSNLTESLKDPVLKRIYSNWETRYKSFSPTWDTIASALFAAIENIQIKVVNSSRGSGKLQYLPNESVRVIAIGGLALSRGLTLEGLVISYFYRNTCTYDVLMQMGRWFGYRKGYEKLFRIWTHKSSAAWYAEIADATESLKLDMDSMYETGKKPRDFGIRVRHNSSELRITAYNKMRNTTDEYDFASYFGGIVETPYLHFNAAAHISNFTAIKNMTENCIARGVTFERQNIDIGQGRYILQSIPKVDIISLLKKMKISRYSATFDTAQIVDFLETCHDPSIDFFDIAFMDGSQRRGQSAVINFCGREIFQAIRTTCVVDKALDRLSIGRKGKLSGPSDGITGICDFGETTRREIIESAKQEFHQTYLIENGIPAKESVTLPSDTWFKFVSKRRPILLVYFINVSVASDESNQKKQLLELKDALNGTPVVGLALGLPSNSNIEKRKLKFTVNRAYNPYELDKDEGLLELKEE